METVSCIFCGKASDQVAITENGYTGVRCDDCALIFLSPRPSAAEISHIYTDEHAVLYADAQFQFDTFNRMEAARTLSRIKQFKPRGSLLELGCGGGDFLAEARNRGYLPHGIELNPIEARWINEKLGIRCEDQPLSPTSFGGERFDIIYHRDVLSHLPDPIGVFKGSNRALKDDGILVFETGNIADVRKTHLGYFSQFSYPDHLFFFGEQSLRKLLSVAGFKCVRIFRENIFLPLLLQKVLWKAKDSLKDENVKSSMQAHTAQDKNGLSVKRRLRLAYRYTRHYLASCGAVLPKAGWPLKLLVVAEKVRPDPQA
jgi:SAM-dependent methyltransferase